MNIQELDISNKEYLKITDLDNIFNIYKDDKGYYFYNLNSTLYLNIDDTLLLDYICDYDMHWPLLSYKIYGTTRLAWFLMKLNKVKSEDVFKQKHATDIVKYLPKDQMNGILISINNIDS